MVHFARLPALVAGCLMAFGLAPTAQAKSKEKPPRPSNQAVGCPVTYQALKTNLQKAAADDSTGLNNNYWGVVVNRAGVVCAVAYSGPRTDSQWLLSRQIAAAKAFTANGLSLDGAPLRDRHALSLGSAGGTGEPALRPCVRQPCRPRGGVRWIVQPVRHGEGPDGGRARRRHDHLWWRAWPLQGDHCDRRGWVVRRHGLRRPLDGLASSRFAGPGTLGRGRQHHPGQRHRPSPLPQRRWDARGRNFRKLILPAYLWVEAESGWNPLPRRRRPPGRGFAIGCRGPRGE